VRGRTCSAAAGDGPPDPVPAFGGVADLLDVPEPDVVAVHAHLRGTGPVPPPAVERGPGHPQLCDDLLDGQQRAGCRGLFVRRVAGAGSGAVRVRWRRPYVRPDPPALCFGRGVKPVSHSRHGMDALAGLRQDALDGTGRGEPDPRSRRRRTLHPDQRALPFDELAGAGAIYAYSFILTNLDVSAPDKAAAVEHSSRHRTTVENIFRDSKLGAALRHPPYVGIPPGQPGLDVGGAAGCEHGCLAAPAHRHHRRPGHPGRARRAAARP
jgi:hypothetical protein